MRDLKVAAVCMHSEPGEIEKNLARTESFVSRASEMGADLICFPELSLTGYVLENPADVYGGQRPDVVMERVVGLARDRGVVIIAGIMEVADRHGSYITQMIAGPEGLLGLYRKTHLSPQEKGGYLAGKKIETFSWKGVTFGVQLCYETHFPEISTVLALKGAEVIFMPHASPRGLPREKFQSWLRHLPSRAFDNSVFVIACNQVGKTRAGFSFPGVVLALNPAGRPIAQYRGSKEKMILFDLKGEELREIREHRMRYFIPYRRPELYAAVITKQ